MMELELVFGSLNCPGRSFLIGLSVFCCCCCFFFLFVVPNNFFGRVKLIIVYNTQEFVTHSFLPHGGRKECVINEPQRTSGGRLYTLTQCL